MVLTDEEIDALLPKITLKGMDPKQQVWLTKKDAIAFVRAAETAETAVIAKLSQGVSVEPVAWMANSWTGTTVTPEERMNKHYCNIPLYTESAIAAARVKALEDAALNCEELHWTWRIGDNSGPKECAEKIRTLKGGA